MNLIGLDGQMKCLLPVVPFSVNLQLSSPEQVLDHLQLPSLCRLEGKEQLTNPFAVFPFLKYFSKRLETVFFQVI